MVSLLGHAMPFSGLNRNVFFSTERTGKSSTKKASTLDGNAASADRKAPAFRVQAKNVLMLLVEEGSIIKVKEDLFFHARALDEIRGRLTQYLKNNGEISTPQFKEMTGASRKYTIPILEYFDAKNITIRVGDIRRLRKQ